MIINSQALFFIIVGYGTSCHADIIYDPNHGTGDNSSLTGPNYQIPASSGIQPGNGNNLFHSFESFNLSADESATFTDIGVTAPVNNIISRVTGGHRSLIDGLLRTQFASGQPNLYFFNPAGVLFGPNSKLDVQGSFYVSTADYLKLSDGTLFQVYSPTEDTLLTSAPPEAFGFVTATPTPITFEGGEAHLLEVNEGKKFSIIGGDISIRNSSIYARDGQINLVSLRSLGNVELGSLDPTQSLPLESLPPGGNIHIQQDRDVTRPSISKPFPRPASNIDTSAEGKGQVFIQGGQLVMRNGNILSSSDNTIQLDHAIHLQERLDIQEVIYIEGSSPTLTIKSPDIKLEDGANIFVINKDNPIENQYNLFIDAESLTVISDIQNTEIVGVSSHMKISTDQLVLKNGSSIEARSEGDLTINASVILLEGVSEVDNKIRSQLHTISNNKASPGTLTIATDTLEIKRGARISTSTVERSQANAGSIKIIAKNSIILDGEGVTGRSRFSIISEAQGPVDEKGIRGSIDISTNKLVIKNGATISAKTFIQGTGGDILINAQSIDLLNEGKITSEGGRNPEESGSITLDGIDNFVNSSITADTKEANAGDINITANFLNLAEQSEITTSAAKDDDNGDGGNISINTSDLLILNSASQITANARKGEAGNITININKGGAFLQTSNSIIEASNEKNINGNIDINAPDTDITSRFKPLSSRIIDASTILQKPCAQRFYTDTISFISQQYEVLPDSPYALRTGLADSILSTEPDQLFSNPSETSHMNFNESLDILCQQTTE